MMAGLPVENSNSRRFSLPTTSRQPFERFSHFYGPSISTISVMDRGAAATLWPAFWLRCTSIAVLRLGQSCKTWISSVQDLMSSRFSPAAIGMESMIANWRGTRGTRRRAATRGGRVVHRDDGSLCGGYVRNHARYFSVIARSCRLGRRSTMF